MAWGPAALLLVWALAVAIIDVRQRRVPNALLLAALLPTVGLLIWRSEGPLSIGWQPGLLGFTAGLLLALPGYAASRFGAGDVKLLATLGLIQGVPAIFWTLLAAALCLGVMAVGTVLIKGAAQARKLRIPAAVAIVGGFAATLILTLGGWR